MKLTKEAFAKAKENTLKAMQDYDTSRISFIAEHSANAAQIRKDYMPGEKRDQMDKLNNDQLAERMETSSKVLRNNLNTLFQDLKDGVRDFAFRAPTPEQVTAFDTFMRFKGSISAGEAAQLMQTVKDYYFGAKAVAPEYSKITGASLMFNNYDDVRSEIEEAEKNLNIWIRDNKCESYNHYLWLAEQDNPVETLLNDVEQFISGTPIIGKIG